ncbi:hypothetical protein NHG28_05985 [Aerococcaceae bacterium NML201209]|nr:hypothetical protein [Aerococcaceae bacterium NML201209]
MRKWRFFDWSKEMKGVNRKVELECVSKDLQQLRENVLRLQVRWEEVNPSRHVVGILLRANHLG